MFVAEVDMLDRFFNFLIGNPSHEEVLELHASEAEVERFNYLSGVLNDGDMKIEERIELEYFMKAEHLIRMAKIRAYGELNKHRE